MTQEKTCFVIAPIGESDSDTRKRSDQVLKHVIRPAVTSCGYKAIRADEIDKPGIITSQVIQHIVNDPLVIADLTERNPNVFYELAVRHALRKPLVQIIRKGDAIPFDVAGTRTINVDHKDLDSVEAAKTEITDQIKSLEKDSSNLETPISVSIDLQLLRQSEKPEERSLADIVSTVVELRTSLSKLETKIGTKDQQGMLDEIQTELRTLPTKLDEYLETARVPWFRRGRFHPMMVREFMHMGPRESPTLGILFIASMFRDWMPWVYELGVELSRLMRQGQSAELAIAAEEFRRAVEFSLHGPMSREFFGKSKDMFFLMEEVEPMLDRILKFDMENERLKLKKSSKLVPPK